MVGRVDKAKVMHDPWRILKSLPDFHTAIRWIKHLRHDKRSHAVLSAIEAVLAPDSGAPRTPDIGGKAGTSDLGRAIAQAVRG
mgnify:CR=1 FL=1